MTLKTMIAKTLVAGAIAAASAHASAAVVAGGAPSGTLYEAYWTNTAAYQNFLVQFTLAADTDVTGFSILSANNYGALGEGTVIRLRADNGGNPAATNLYELNDTVDAITAFDNNTHWLTSNFAPITLSAGTYWMGLSSTGSGVWSSYNNGNGQQLSTQRQLSGNTVVGTPYIYELGYEVLGTTSAGAVPEPATWAMMIGGFALAGAGMRRGKTRTQLRFA